MSDPLDDDRARLARGEPAWGDVLPGTDAVRYFVPTDPGLGPTLCRTVEKLEAFYVESYRGQGRWESDSDPFTWLTGWPDSPPNSRELAPVEAALLMTTLDEMDAAWWEDRPTT